MKPGRPEGFKTDKAELHMGILQNRMRRLKEEMFAVANKLNMDASKVEGGIDKPAEETKFAQLDTEYKLYEKNLEEYESKVLDLTKLPE